MMLSSFCPKLLNSSYFLFQKLVKLLVHIYTCTSILKKNLKDLSRKERATNIFKKQVEMLNTEVHAPRIDSFSKNIGIENWTVKSRSTILIFFNILPMQQKDGFWEMNFPHSFSVKLKVECHTIP